MLWPGKKYEGLLSPSLDIFPTSLRKVVQSVLGRKKDDFLGGVGLWFVEMSLNIIQELILRESRLTPTHVPAVRPR